MKVTLARRRTAQARYNVKVNNKSVECGARMMQSMYNCMGGPCTLQSLRFNDRFGESFKRERRCR